EMDRPSDLSTHFEMYHKGEGLSRHSREFPGFAAFHVSGERDTKNLACLLRCPYVNRPWGCRVFGQKTLPLTGELYLQYWRVDGYCSRFHRHALREFPTKS